MYDFQSVDIHQRNDPSPYPPSPIAARRTSIHEYSWEQTVPAVLWRKLGHRAWAKLPERFMKILVIEGEVVDDKVRNPTWNDRNDDTILSKPASTAGFPVPEPLAGPYELG